MRKVLFYDYLLIMYMQNLPKLAQCTCEFSHSRSCADLFTAIGCSLNVIIIFVHCPQFPTPGVGHDMSYLHCFLSSAISSVMFSFDSSCLLPLPYSRSSLARPTYWPFTFHFQLHHSPKYAVLIPAFYMTKPSQTHFP